MSVSYELRARMALEKHGFRTTHSLGQNFLFDERLLEHLLDMAEVGPDDNILEIGPGPGLFTALISQRCNAVTSIELDEKLRPVLETVLEDRPNAHLVFGDAMRLDLGRVAREHMGDGAFRVVANLPYYITTDVITRLITAGLPISDICVMVQKEAAERMMSRPGEKRWCAVAAIIDYFGTAEVLCDVPREAFEPAPHVDSAFIRISVHENKPVRAKSDEMMLKVIEAAFHMRRKKLTNNMKALFAMTAEEAEAALNAAGIDTGIRGEALEISQLANLSDILYDIKN